MTSVDVFIACYNYGRFLERCVASVLSQDGVQVRVLIIDDASTDGSLEEARRIAARDSRVSVLAHPVNKGHIATYNEGIAWASAPYMVLVSADDLLAPLALSRSTALMEAQPNVGFVFGPLCQFDDIGNKEADATEQARAADPSASVIAGRDFIADICRRPICLVPASGAIARTALQHRIGGYLPELPHAADFEMWLRMAAHADVGTLQAPTALTRLHPANMQLGYYADQMIGDYRQRVSAFDKFFEGNAGQLPDADALSRTARHSLAMEVLVASDHCFGREDYANMARLTGIAQEIDPTITRTAWWWRTVLKRAVGWKWCNRFSQARLALRNVAAMVRRRRAPFWRFAKS
jgi:glycosyltransferase involved in cell wall biosynthesis